MKKIIISTILLITLVGILVFFWHSVFGPTTDLNQLEPIVLGMTMSLEAFVLETSDTGSCTVPGFSGYIESTNPKWSNIFSDYVRDLKVKNKDAILIIQDKKSSKLLFEDGTWSSKLDAPHWRMPNLPRLSFPIASGGEIK